MHNFERQFADVPIVSVQSDLPSDREWLISARNNESYKAFALCFVIRDMAETAPDKSEPATLEMQESQEELISKLSFMYNYVMNFRSK